MYQLQRTGKKKTSSPSPRGSSLVIQKQLNLHTLGRFVAPKMPAYPYKYHPFCLCSLLAQRSISGGSTATSPSHRCATKAHQSQFERHTLKHYKINVAHSKLTVKLKENQNKTP